LSKEELQAMLHRRGFAPGLSFGAFENHKLVSFTLNGIGYYNGIKTAYDTGTGTLDKYRGKGLASKIFKTAVPFLKEAGMEQYVLEVLQHNPKAVSVYRKLDFKVSQEFNYFMAANADVKLTVIKLPPKLRVKETSLENLKDISEFWDFTPSWQNSFEAINRCLSDFKIFAAFHGDKIVGYGVFERRSGDITQIAVDKAFRRIGVGSALLKKMIKINQSTSIKLINSAITCTTMEHFLEANDISLKGKQFEMIKQL
jgi:ribosomal protein S18 acetylase RimI-like enzyme